MHIKPKPGIVLRDPDRKDVVPAEGRVVPDTGFWYRRVRDGDAEIVTAPAGNPS